MIDDFVREDFVLMCGCGENCMFDISRCCVVWVLGISVGMGIVVDKFFIFMVL